MAPLESRAAAFLLLFLPSFDPLPFHLSLLLVVFYGCRMEMLPLSSGSDDVPTNTQDEQSRRERDFTRMTDLGVFSNLQGDPTGW